MRLAAAALAALSGCAAQDPAPSPAGAGMDDPCGAAAWTSFVGRTEAEFRAAEPPAPFRVICADCMVTMDHLPNRLNAKLDKAGRIVAFTCG